MVMGPVGATVPPPSMHLPQHGQHHHPQHLQQQHHQQQQHHYGSAAAAGYMDAGAVKPASPDNKGGAAVQKQFFSTT